MQQTGDEKIEPYTLAHMNVTYRDRSTGELRSDKKDVAKFGEYHVAQVTGILVHVRSVAGDEPYTACSLPLRPSYGEFPTTERWIALVKRGKCNFQQKVENAFHSNASGIIIYNDKDVPNLEKMRLQRNVPREYLQMRYDFKCVTRLPVTQYSTRVVSEGRWYSSIITISS